MAEQGITEADLASDGRTPKERLRDEARGVADLIIAGFAPSVRALWRRYTDRQLRAFQEALAFRDYTERRSAWELTRLQIQAAGGKLGEFPDYVSPEEGHHDAVAIEERLDAMLEGGAFKM